MLVRVNNKAFHGIGIDSQELSFITNSRTKKLSLEDLRGNNNYNFSFIIVGFLAVGVLLFPLGLDSPFARDVCGLEAKMFAADECQVAWGYVLAIMTVSLTIFCPILGKYSTESKDNYKGVANTGTYSDYDYQKSEIASLTASSTSTRSKVMTTV